MVMKALQINALVKLPDRLRVSYENGQYKSIRK
jgi:hypothetical protein